MEQQKAYSQQRNHLDPGMKNIGHTKGHQGTRTTTASRTQNRHLAPAASGTLLVPSWRRFCMVKCNISRPGYLPKCPECCACHEKSDSHFTKYCACHANWMSSMICVTYETSFPMRRASKCHPPTSPNTAPATQNERHRWSARHMKRHFQCAEQVKSPSNLTKYCACHEILKLKIWAETPWRASANRKTIRRYPSIIRA